VLPLLFSLVPARMNACFQARSPLIFDLLDKLTTFTRTLLGRIVTQVIGLSQGSGPGFYVFLTAASPSFLTAPPPMTPRSFPFNRTPLTPSPASLVLTWRLPWPPSWPPAATCCRCRRWGLAARLRCS
jgi:hypothetical protein